MYILRLNDDDLKPKHVGLKPKHVDLKPKPRLQQQQIPLLLL